MSPSTTRSDRPRRHPAPAASTRGSALGLHLETLRLRCRSALRRLKRSRFLSSIPTTKDPRQSPWATGMVHIDRARIGVSEEKFLACLHLSDTYKSGSLGRRDYIDAS